MLRRLDRSLVPDFFALHSDANDNGWCHCVAWWVPTWDGWSDRTAEENRRLREDLFERGEFDGYLHYEGERPVGWCQVGRRDRLEKLVGQFGLTPDPEVWAVSCVLVAPSARGTGVARAMLSGVLEDLRARGVRRVQAYPKRGESTDPGEQWRGPARLFEELGFRPVPGARTIVELVLSQDPDGSP